MNERGFVLSDQDILLAGHALSEFCLEGAAGLVEHKLRGKVGANRLGCWGRPRSLGGSSKCQSRLLAQSKGVHLGVKVKGSSRSGGSSCSPSRCQNSLGGIASHIEEIIKSRSCRCPCGLGRSCAKAHLVLDCGLGIIILGPWSLGTGPCTVRNV